MTIAILMVIMIAIVVGVNLIPVVEEALEEVPVEDGESVLILMKILPIIFVVVLILGMVAWIGGIGEIRDNPIGRWISNWTTGRPNSASLEQYFLSRSWAYRADRANLDKIVGIELELVEGTEEEPLQLHDRTLVLSKEFAWYLDEKSPRGIMYKIVGFHRRHRNLNSVFILGRDAHTTIPFLLRLPPSFLQEPLEDCLKWCIQSGKGDIIKEV